jgi:hypothetical protein
MKKVICFVLTTKKHSDRIKNVFETWSNDVDTVFYSDHENIEMNVIKVSDRDDYASAEEKQINLLNYIKNLLNGDDKYLLEVYDWIFFVDDDTFVNVKNLKSYIQTIDQNKVYGSIFNSEKDSKNPVYLNGSIPLESKFPSGGAGFLVSSKIIKQIGEFKNYNTMFSDVGAGLNFYYNGVDQVDNSLFNSQNPEFYGHTKMQIDKMITYHYIKTFAEMKKLYEGKYE